MRLLITRPEQDAGALAAALSEHGHSARLEPLIAIVPDPDAVIPDKRYQAVLVTSANGVRALAGNAGFERLQGTPVLAVGRASAEASRQAGFARIEDASGDLHDLVRLVGEHCSPAAGPLLYAAGKVISGDLKAMLEAEGYEVDRVVLYDAVPAERLTSGALSALRSGEIDGVLHFSPRTARVWARLAPNDARDLVHFCLSQAVADALLEELDEPAGSIRVAERPNQDALMALIDRA